MIGKGNTRFLLASDAGYGFIAKLSDLKTKNRSGKAAITLVKDGRVVSPSLIPEEVGSFVVAVSNEGRLLMFPTDSLPQLTKGKGNKLIAIPTERFKSREEWMIGVEVVKKGDVLVVSAGKRKMKLKFSDLERYRGERGRRGSKLPQGLRKVDSIEIASKQGLK